MSERFVGDGRLRLSGRNERTLIGCLEVPTVPVRKRATRQFGAFDDFGRLPLDHVSDRAAGII
jgi:hypothetical protein